MGCVNACVCSANCLRCSQYEPEQYFGHAEDVYAQMKGYASDDEYRRAKRLEAQQSEEYYKQAEEYYRSEEENYYKEQLAKAMASKNVNDFCKSANCPNYIEWDCGYGLCISCKLQGQSYVIESLAENCPFK